MSLSRNGNDLPAKVVLSGETLKIANQYIGTHGIEQLAFADGTIWDRATIASNAWIAGTTGNDRISGTSDVFFGDLGDDRFNSGAGSDTYIVVATVTMPAISHPAAQAACIKSLTERHRC
jgi:hypothetical protein